MNIIFLPLAYCVLIKISTGDRYFGTCCKKLTVDGDRIVELSDKGSAIDFTIKSKKRGVKFMKTGEPVKLGLSDDGYLVVKPLREKTHYFEVEELGGNKFVLKIKDNCVQYLPKEDHFAMRECHTSDQQVFEWDNSESTPHVNFESLKRAMPIPPELRPTLKRDPFIPPLGSVVSLPPPHMPMIPFHPFGGPPQPFPVHNVGGPSQAPPGDNNSFLNKLFDGFPSLKNFFGHKTPSSSPKVNPFNPLDNPLNRPPRDKANLNSKFPDSPLNIPSPIKSPFDEKDPFKSPPINPSSKVNPFNPLDNPLSGPPRNRIKPDTDPSDNEDTNPADSPKSNSSPKPKQKGKLPFSPFGPTPNPETPLVNPVVSPESSKDKPSTKSPLDSKLPLDGPLLPESGFKTPDDLKENDPVFKGLLQDPSDTPDVLSPKTPTVKTPFKSPSVPMTPNLSSNIPEVPPLPGITPQSRKGRPLSGFPGKSTSSKPLISPSVDDEPNDKPQAQNSENVQPEPTAPESSPHEPTAPEPTAPEPTTPEPTAPEFTPQEPAAPEFTPQEPTEPFPITSIQEPSPPENPLERHESFSLKKGHD